MLRTSDSNPLVSVLTPVYNGEKYLSECIESVLAQSYQSWEYIIVNNCSTDRTLQIAESYRQKDSRIRVVTNRAFVDALGNHHIAFRQISPESKYCKVLHADDWLFPECLTRMIEVAETHASVGIVSSYRLDGVRVDLNGLPYPSTIVPGHEICRQTLLKRLNVFGSPSSLLLRSELLRDCERFYDGSLFTRHWDTAACFEILRNWDFGFVHQVLTYTRRPSEARTSVSKELDSYMAENLLMLKKYGPLFVDPGECEKLLKERTKSYLKFLGKGVLHQRSKQFWEYHKHSLDNLGIPLTSFRWFPVVSIALVEVLKAPVRSLLREIRET